LFFERDFERWICITGAQVGQVNFLPLAGICNISSARFDSRWLLLSSYENVNEPSYASKRKQVGKS